MVRTLEGARGNESEPVADDQVDEQMIGAAFESSHESRFTAVRVPGLSAVDRRQPMSLARVEEPPEKPRVPELLMRPARRHKRIKIVEDRLEPLKVGVVEKELLQSGAPFVEFGWRKTCH